MLTYACKLKLASLVIKSHVNLSTHGAERIQCMLHGHVVTTEEKKHLIIIHIMFYYCFTDNMQIKSDGNHIQQAKPLMLTKSSTVFWKLLIGPLVSLTFTSHYILQHIDSQTFFFKLCFVHYHSRYNFTPMFLIIYTLFAKHLNLRQCFKSASQITFACQ